KTAKPHANMPARYQPNASLRLRLRLRLLRVPVAGCLVLERLERGANQTRAADSIMDRKKRPAQKPPLQCGTKLIVRMLVECRRSEAFESYADLTEELKCRLAKLKIPYNASLIGDAIERIE